MYMTFSEWFFLLQAQNRFLPDNGDSFYESVVYVVAALFLFFHCVRWYL